MNTPTELTTSSVSLLAWYLGFYRRQKGDWRDVPFQTELTYYSSFLFTVAKHALLTITRTIVGFLTYSMYHVSLYSFCNYSLHLLHKSDGKILFKGQLRSRPGNSRFSFHNKQLRRTNMRPTDLTELFEDSCLGKHWSIRWI